MELTKTEKLKTLRHILCLILITYSLRPSLFWAVPILKLKTSLGPERGGKGGGACSAHLRAAWAEAASRVRLVGLPGATRAQNGVVQITIIVSSSATLRHAAPRSAAPRHAGPGPPTCHLPLLLRSRNLCRTFTVENPCRPSALLCRMKFSPLARCSASARRCVGDQHRPHASGLLTLSGDLRACPPPAPPAWWPSPGIWARAGWRDLDAIAQGSCGKTIQH